MPSAAPLICNFNGGEASPFTKARADLAKYPNLCGLIRNFLLRVQGGASKRSGTRYVKNTKNQNTTAVLLPFLYGVGAGQNYMIEAGDLYFRYFANRGRLESAPNVPVETVTPYPLAELPYLDYAQSLDEMRIVNGLRAPTLLQRLSATVFSLTNLTILGGPFKDQNITATTVYASVGTGTVDLVASADIFTAGHVGALFELVIEDLSGLKPWYGGANVNTSDKRRNAGKIYTAGSSATTGGIGPTHDEGIVSDGVVDWEFKYKIRGYGRITTVTDGQHASMDVIETLPDEVVGSGNATKRWSFGQFSNADTWPTNITPFGDRTVLLDALLRAYGSVVGDYDNYARYNSASEQVKDQAFIVQMNSAKGSRPAWLSSIDKKLLVGTTADEFVVEKLSSGEAFGAGNMEADVATGFGSVTPQRPVLEGKHLLFLDRAGTSLVDYYSRFDANTDGFDGDNQNLFSDHVLYPQALKTVFVKAPIPMLWALKKDGTLASLTFQKDQVVAGWAPQEIAGYGGAESPGHAFVEDIGVIPASEGTWDELWMVVRRTRSDGQVWRAIEYMEKPFNTGDDPEQAFHVDSGLSLNNVQAQTLALTGGWDAAGTGRIATAGMAMFGPSDEGRRIEYRYQDFSERDPVRQWKTARAEINSVDSPTQVTCTILRAFPQDGVTLAASSWRLSVTQISGLDHLEGREVAVYANAAVQNRKTVTGGSITLDAPAGYVTVGLPLVARLAPLSPEAGSANGTAQGKKKNIVEFVLRLWATLSLKYRFVSVDAEVPLGTPTELDFRTAGTPADEGPAPFTGFTDDLTNEGEFEREAIIEMLSDEPGPCTILTYRPVVKTNG